MSAKPTFYTFIFDLDGTILDTLPDLVVMTNEALAESGLPKRTSEEIVSFVGDGAKMLVRRAVPEDTPEEVTAIVWNRLKQLFIESGDELTRPFPQVEETLAVLQRRGCKLGVVSNKFGPGVPKIIGQYLPGYFEVLVGEGPDVPRKPDPTGLLLAIEQLGSTPERTAYVGDSPSDIAAARNAGTYAIGVSWGYRRVESLYTEDFAPDIVIDQFSDLLQLAPEVAS